jgi:hypothetical protein
MWWIPNHGKAEEEMRRARKKEERKTLEIKSGSWHEEVT